MKVAIKAMKETRMTNKASKLSLINTFCQVEIMKLYESCSYENKTTLWMFKEDEMMVTFIEA